MSELVFCKGCLYYQYVSVPHQNLCGHHKNYQPKTNAYEVTIGFVPIEDVNANNDCKLREDMK